VEGGSVSPDLHDRCSPVQRPAFLASGIPHPERCAAHIAMAALHSMDFLVTWNCARIADAAMAEDVPGIFWDCHGGGFPVPSAVP
jgi:hypothetical protein